MSIISGGIKGKVIIDKYEAEFVDGEWVPVKHVETIEQDNRITIELYWRLMQGASTGRNDMVTHVSEGMFLGAVHARPSPGLNNFVDASIANADTYTAAVPGGADAFHEFSSTVNPPTSGTRQIRTICLTSNSSSYYYRAYTIVNLPTPCSQTDVEILQITYRLINDQSAVTALGLVSNSISERIFQFITYTTGGEWYIPSNIYLLPYDSKIWGKGIGWRGGATIGRTLATNANSQEIYRGSTVSTFATDYVAEGFYGCTAYLRLGINNDVNSSEDPCGMLIKGGTLGNGAWSTISDVSKGSLSSVGNIFGRIADTGAQDRKAYLDNNLIASSGAVVNLIDKGDWVNYTADSYLVPYLYRIKVVAGGLTGVATYKLQRRKSPVRWVDNRVEWSSHGIPFQHFKLVGNVTEEEYMDVTTADTRKHGQTITHTRGWRDNNSASWQNRNDLGDTRSIANAYVYPEFYSWDYDGLTFMSLDEHNWTNLDANSAQAQTFTEILQVGSDGLDVYVADASQGLYKIERDFGDFNTSNWTITKLNPPGITNTNSCRGVYLKGGSYHYHPGKIVDVNIIQGGSNYAVDDTITVTGVNGTGATANVARVDADGAITAISISSQGSGYIEDHVQAYVSSGSGVGAQLEPIIGAGGNLWAIFNDTTDSVVYLAHMTHIVDDSTSLNFDNSNPYVITGNGTSFITQGFRTGQRLIVRHAEDAANEGTYTISAVTATTITVTEAITTNNAADTQAQIIGEDWEIMRETITTTETVTFANATADTITGTGTSFITQGFREGMKIVISGSGGGSNDGIYTLTNVTATVMTIAENENFGNFVAESVTIAALTDFTITNYTSGTPGGTGFVGLVMDPDHADDRFAMLTPDTKQANDGTTLQSDAGFDWWSFANSTGTTAAGTTDRVRVAAHNNTNRTISLEQFCTHSIGPMSDNTWVVAGLSETEMSSYTWGSATRTARNDNAILYRYMPHRCKTNFDIGVTGCGTFGTAALKSNRVASTDFTDSTYDSIIAVYADSQTEPSLTDYNPGEFANGTKAVMHGYLGKGVWWSRMSDTYPASGGYLWAGNADGTKAGEDAMPYGTWQDFGWDGTRWVLDNAGARTAHAQSSFSGTSLNINATTGAIVGTGFASTDWAGDGFEAGDIITIASAEDATNNGDYRIESLSGTTLTVTPDKLPAVTNVDDTTATVVGHRAIIDGLALSFDTTGGGAAPLVANEYYDCWVADGILNDNATDGTIQVYHPWLPTVEGSDFESVTIPSSDVGAIVNEPLTMVKKCADYGEASGPFMWPEKPGVFAMAASDGAHDDIMFSDQQIPASTDFTFRFKIAHSGAGSTGGTGSGRMDVGVAPQALAADPNMYTDTNMDYNLRVIYDYYDFPTLDQYTIEIRNTGSGTVQHTENADRVVLIEGQTHTNYTGGAPNGSFIGGYESATDTHSASDILTMDDGTIVTVDAVDANGTITNFTVTTNSTKSSGNSQIGAVSSSATSIDFNTTGNVITRTAGGTDFITDGFRIGMKIQVDGATTEANDGAYTIQSVTTTTIVTEENLNTTETGTSATIDHCIVQTASTGTGVNFALIPGTNNLVAADVGNDEYALNRRGTTGNNLYWTLNGVEFYTHTGGPFNAQYNPCMTPNNNYSATVYDANVDHTVDRRYVKIGNGTTTGRSDNNFRVLPTVLAGTDRLRLYYNDGSGPVEFTYVTDGRTAPAAGEVTILPYAGILWFNSAQGGDTLTGNWTITTVVNPS